MSPPYGPRQWVFNPHVGGRKIPLAVRQRTERRILAYARERYSGKYTRIGVRFRGPLCYIDAYSEPSQPSPTVLQGTGETREQYIERLRTAPLHLCRLRYFGDEDAWTLAY